MTTVHVSPTFAHERHSLANLYQLNRGPASSEFLPLCAVYSAVSRASKCCLPLRPREKEPEMKGVFVVLLAVCVATALAQQSATGLTFTESTRTSRLGGSREGEGVRT